ncbi:glycoside hydrolase, putative [Phytophthora infestans T30-4]|uniref:glucan endo-1,3-beta-D-glucosidase n=1 Tax=Phytophthora infestans (strain T30-4) TaxID=403677 RepID=D0N0M4_PHYIT|nr:glycoside hydrolase, putative [Phytophthora infestans T30-4]EEY67187.1 glycoside hydrolase, putative [Phytophthora infestans T30-4]|eukprot:XP_002905835.1 glycoside hydrolase, putative [Phytophthora infestans T30-4]
MASSFSDIVRAVAQQMIVMLPDGVKPSTCLVHHDPELGVQSNSYNCGVYVLLEFEMFCGSEPLGHLAKKTLQRMRHRYLRMRRGPTITAGLGRFKYQYKNSANAVVPAAIEAGLKIELGMWVDSSASSFETEKAAFKTLLDTGIVQSEHIVGIHVSSEAVYRKDITVDVAISHLEEIRTLCKANSGAAGIPLTIADIGDTYSAYPQLIEAVDYVSANYFPFWEKTDIDVAADSFYKRFSALVATASTYNKEVIIGETGWASDGVGAGASPATAANAAKFFYNFYTLATEKKLTYYYFSAFDEPWKLPTLEANETVEAYFGLFTHEGVLKDAVAAKFDNATSSSVDGSNSGTTTLVGSTTTTDGDNATPNETTSDDATQDVTTSGDVEDNTSTSMTTTQSHNDCAM